MIVRDVSASTLIRFLEGRLRRGPQLLLGFVNQHFVVACQGLITAGRATNDILLVNDGIGVELAARLLYGRGFTANLNGTDFMPRLLGQAKPDMRIFLLGARPTVVAKAAAMVDAMPRRRVVGYADGFSVWQHERETLDAIAAARPDVLLIGFGNPAQEKWVLDHRERIEARLVIAVGALFDWMTGEKPRAPSWVRRARLEWVYRLALEPRRLAKRYTWGILKFAWLVLRARLSRCEPKGCLPS